MLGVKKLGLAMVAVLTTLPVWSTPSYASTVYLSTHQLSGCYSEDGDTLLSNSICLFDNGKFYYPMLLNLTGDYEIEGNKLVFYPHQREIFEIYGRQDPKLKEGTKLNFTGFNFDSLINIDNQGFGYMPIESQRCYWEPKVELYQHPSPINELSLAYAAHDGQATQTMISYNYQLTDQYNDFLLIYHRPDISTTRAAVLTLGEDMWLQMGKNTLSMQKIPMPYKDVQKLKDIGRRVEEAGGIFPKMIDQDDNLTMQNPDAYFVDKLTNHLLLKPVKQGQGDDPLSKSWARFVKKNDSDKGHYLKVYQKVSVLGQSMNEVIIEQRPEISETNNCL